MRKVLKTEPQGRKIRNSRDKSQKSTAEAQQSEVLSKPSKETLWRRRGAMHLCQAVAGQAEDS